MTNQHELYWHNPDWQKQAHEWVRAQVEQNSIEITGDIEQPHLYPWSTVLIVPTADGRLFFKATAPETIYEAAAQPHHRSERIGKLSLFGQGFQFPRRPSNQAHKRRGTDVVHTLRLRNGKTAAFRCDRRR